MSGHTPGPWSIRKHKRCYVKIDAPSHNAIAKVVWQMKFGGTDDALEANARLIAAAPELLEALQALIKYDVFVDQSVSQEMLDYVTAQVDARAAIAKATVAA